MFNMAIREYFRAIYEGLYTKGAGEMYICFSSVSVYIILEYSWFADSAISMSALHFQEAGDAYFQS